MLKFNHTKLVQEEVCHLLDEVFDICEKNDIPFFSFIMAAADQEEKSTDWVTSRMVPDIIQPDMALPAPLWDLLEISTKISRDR